MTAVMLQLGPSLDDVMKWVSDLNLDDAARAKIESQRGKVLRQIEKHGLITKMLGGTDFYPGHDA